MDPHTASDDLLLERVDGRRRGGFSVMLEEGPMILLYAWTETHKWHAVVSDSHKESKTFTHVCAWHAVLLCRFCVVLGRLHAGHPVVLALLVAVRSLPILVPILRCLALNRSCPSQLFNF